jgi:hypothetical protein
MAIAYRIEKRKKHAGTLFLMLICVVQIIESFNFTLSQHDSFKPLDKKATLFVENTTRFEWIFTEDIPFRPDLYEELAYYAFNNDITINAFPLIRFPTEYKENLMTAKEDFLAQEFHKNTIYIIKKNQFSKEYLTLGEIIYIKDNILFKAY